MLARRGQFSAKKGHKSDVSSQVRILVSLAKDHCYYLSLPFPSPLIGLVAARPGFFLFSS